MSEASFKAKASNPNSGLPSVETARDEEEEEEEEAAMDSLSKKTLAETRDGSGEVNPYAIMANDRWSTRMLVRRVAASSSMPVREDVIRDFFVSSSRAFDN